MIILRDYQDQFYQELKRKIAAGYKRIIGCLPTGGGKTVIFSKITQDAIKKGSVVLIISDRIELLTQSSGTLKQFGINSSLITAETKNPNYKSDCYVAMTNTLKNRLKKPEWLLLWRKIDVIIIDECHISTFNWITKHEKGKYKVGFTATPKRSGNMPQLSDEYDTIVYGPDVQELINLKYLVPDKIFEVPVDISGVSKTGDDYNLHELYKKYDNPKTYSGLVTNWNLHAKNMQTLCFCVNIAHSIQTCIELNKSGIKAKFITSKPGKPKVPDNDNKASWTLYKRKIAEYNKYIKAYDIYSGVRSEIIQNWKDGDFPILINAGILIAGFDWKPTQCIVMYRATTSENLWRQIIGRGSRSSEDTGKKNFIILDFGENGKRLGYYRQEREYSLSHNKNKGDGVPPSKECPECKSLVLGSSQICKYCGYFFPKEKEEQKDVMLVEHEYNDAKADFSQMSFKELESYAKKTGKPKTWVWKMIYYKKGETELKNYAKLKGYSNGWVWKSIRQYRRKTFANYKINN